jgi:hypothetical protein
MLEQHNLLISKTFLVDGLLGHPDNPVRAFSQVRHNGGGCSRRFPFQRSFFRRGEVRVREEADGGFQVGVVEVHRAPLHEEGAGRCR